MQNGPTRGNRFASTVATAKLAVLCPDGKESKPDDQERVICQSPEWTNFGRGLPMRCFSPLASKAASPWAINNWIATILIVDFSMPTQERVG